MFTRIKEMWYRIPESFRYEIRSVAITFVAAFATTIYLVLEAGGDVVITRETLIALFAAALRSGLKAMFTLIFAKLSSITKK